MNDMELRDLVREFAAISKETEWMERKLKKRYRMKSANTFLLFPIQPPFMASDVDICCGVLIMILAK